MSAPGSAPDSGRYGSAVTVGRALWAAARRLRDVEPGSARLESELLLAHVLDVPRSELLARSRAPLGTEAAAAFALLVTRRAGGEPVAYLIERAPFLDFHVRVTPDVLIPRPESEVLAEWAVALAASRARPLTVLDVGTGSGALALALARAMPDAVVHATDVSPAALAVASDNAARLGLTRAVRLHRADLLPPAPRLFDVVVANLPYVAELELSEVQPSVLRYEPAAALLAGPDGLDAIRRLLDRLPCRLAPDGAAGLEIGHRQGPAALRLARAAFPEAAVRLLGDMAGRDRVVVIERAPAAGVGGLP